MLVRGEGSPLWQQIARQIEQDIRGQVLRPGDKLPTEWELTQRFQVNRHTVRRALAFLAETGSIRAEQGRGTFVQEGTVDYPINRKTRFETVVRERNQKPGGRLLSISEERASCRFAGPLEITAGTVVNVLEVLRTADGFPVSMVTHVYEKARFPRVAQVVAENGSIVDAMVDAGLANYSRTDTKVTARLPSPHETRLLQTSKTRPVLLVEALEVDSIGVPLMISYTRFPADRVQLVFKS